MTLKQIRLLPAIRNDRASALTRLELGASRVGQFVQCIGAEIRQSVALEPRPKVFDRVQFWRIRWQETDLDMSIGGIDVIAYQLTVVRSSTVPQDQQRLANVRPERPEKFDDLFLLDRRSEEHTSELQSH